MYAIVNTGGKQYKVAEGDTLEVELLDAKPGETVALDVVFLADGSKITSETDELAKAKVYAEVIEHFKGDKTLVFKFKKRKGYKKLQGHRQGLTRLLVQSINPTGAAPAKKAAAKPAPVKAAKTSEVKTDKTAAVPADAVVAEKTETAPVAKKPAAAKKPVTDTAGTAEKKPAAAKKPAVKKADAEETAEKPAKKPAAKKTPASETAAPKKPAAKKAAPKKATEDEKAE